MKKWPIFNHFYLSFSLFIEPYLFLSFKIYLTFTRIINYIKLTFNIPRIDNGDTPLGITTSIQLFGQYTHGSVPNITGHISTAGNYGAETFTYEGITYSGAFWIDNQTGWRYNVSNNSAGKYTDLYFDASRSSNLYQNNESDIKACGVYMFYIIKY